MAAPSAHAIVAQTVNFNALNSAITLTTPFDGQGLELIVNSITTGGAGALHQSITFTMGSGINPSMNPNSFYARASWSDGSSFSSLGLTGVNIDIFASNGALLASDTSLGSLGGYGVSQIPLTFVGLGTYTMVITGTSQYSSQMSLTLGFAAGPAPEPQSYALMAAGLSMLALVVARRRRS